MGNQPSVETNYVMYVFLLVALYGLRVVYGNACIAVKSESGTRQSVCQECLEICPSTVVILIVVLYTCIQHCLLADLQDTPLEHTYNSL